MIVDLGPGADVSLAGGKARGLQRLLDAGLPCPPAFCVTTEALDAYVDEGGLRERLESRPATPLREVASTPRGVLVSSSTGVTSTPPGVLTHAEEVRTLAFEADLPVAFEAELATAIARLRERAPGRRARRRALLGGGRGRRRALLRGAARDPARRAAEGHRRCRAFVLGLAVGRGRAGLPRRARTGAGGGDDGRRRAGARPRAGVRGGLHRRPADRRRRRGRRPRHPRPGAGAGRQRGHAGRGDRGQSGPGGPVVRDGRQAPAPGRAPRRRSRAPPTRRHHARADRRRTGRARRRWRSRPSAASGSPSTSRPRSPTAGRCCKPARSRPWSRHDSARHPRPLHPPRRDRPRARLARRRAHLRRALRTCRRCRGGDRRSRHARDHRRPEVGAHDRADARLPTQRQARISAGCSAPAADRRAARRGRSRADPPDLGIDRSAEAGADHPRGDHPLQRLGGDAFRDRAWHARPELLRTALRPLDPGGLDHAHTRRLCRAGHAAPGGARPRARARGQRHPGRPAPVLVAARTRCRTSGTRS